MEKKTQTSKFLFSSPVKVRGEMKLCAATKTLYHAINELFSCNCLQTLNLVSSYITQKGDFSLVDDAI